MKIGIIGSGHVGGTLGVRWAHLGHQIIFASRAPESAKTKSLVARAGASAKSAGVAETASFSETLLLATPWEATQEALAACGDLHEKPVMDATNPLMSGLVGLHHGSTHSGGETVAAWAPSARIIKVFNTVGYNIMESPSFADGIPLMLFCGDDQSAKAMIRPLIDELGFESVDAGPLAQSRYLEPLALLWIKLAMQQGFGREIAFQLIRR